MKVKKVSFKCEIDEDEDAKMKNLKKTRKATPLPTTAKNNDYNEDEDSWGSSSQEFDDIQDMKEKKVRFNKKLKEDKPLQQIGMKRKLTPFQTQAK